MSSEGMAAWSSTGRSACCDEVCAVAGIAFPDTAVGVHLLLQLAELFGIDFLRRHHLGSLGNILGGGGDGVGGVDGRTVVHSGFRLLPVGFGLLPGSFGGSQCLQFLLRLAATLLGSGLLGLGSRLLGCGLFGTALCCGSLRGFLLSKEVVERRLLGSLALLGLGVEVLALAAADGVHLAVVFGNASALTLGRGHPCSRVLGSLVQDGVDDCLQIVVL